MRNRYTVKAMLAVFALVTCLLVVSEASAGIVTEDCLSTSEPASNEVLLYQHSNFRGRCWRVAVGSGEDYYVEWPPYLGILNDAISSVKIGYDATLTMYQHWSFNQYEDGAMATWTWWYGANAYPPYRSIGWWSDRMSSFEVYSY